MNKNNKLLVLVILGVVLIAGAVYILWPNQSESPEIDYVVEEPVATDTKFQAPTDEAIASENTSEIGSETPTAESVVDSTATATTKPTPRAEMEGTDPGSVNLASGNFQLVELFAFW